MRPAPSLDDRRQVHRAAACRAHMRTPGSMLMPSWQAATNRALRRSERQATREALRSLASRGGG